MIEKVYNIYCVLPSDINEHLPILKKISEDCSHITELGVRAMVSSWAFLEGLRGRGGKLVSMDIVSPDSLGTNLEVVKQVCKEERVDFEFILGSSLELDIEPTDFLFIDTLHFGDHLTKELARHASKVKKYLGFHDVISCAEELIPVIEKFQIEHEEWKMFYYSVMNNGLMILTKNGKPS